jgi:hypothetical protein
MLHLDPLFVRHCDAERTCNGSALPEAQKIATIRLKSRVRPAIRIVARCERCGR